MKNRHFKAPAIITAVLLTLTILFLLCSCSSCNSCSIDPNVATDDEKSTYKVDLGNGQTDNPEGEGFQAFGDGKLDPITLDGVKVEVKDFAIYSFELAYDMGQEQFKDVHDINIDSLTQYGFTHIYYDFFYQIPNKGMLFKEAEEKDIKKELKELFGYDDFKLTDSILYNPKSKKFEMWLPEYGMNIYYRVDAANIIDDRAEIITTFYNEKQKSTLFGRTTITVKIKDKKPVISALSTK